MTSAPGIVHIVDDDEGLRAAVVRLVRSDGLDALGHANIAELNDALNVDVPSCVILDMRLQDDDGLAVQKALRDRGHSTPIIFLTGYGTIPLTVQAMRGGAEELLTKPVTDSVLLAAIRRALERDSATTQQRHSKSDLTRRVASLSGRELEVLMLAIGGLMNKQIAGELGITEITAKVHKGRVMAKMQARSLPDLVRMSDSLGIKAVRNR